MSHYVFNKVIYKGETVPKVTVPAVPAISYGQFRGMMTSVFGIEDNESLKICAEWDDRMRPLNDDMDLRALFNTINAIVMSGGGESARIPSITIKLDGPSDVVFKTRTPSPVAFSAHKALARRILNRSSTTTIAANKDPARNRGRRPFDGKEQFEQLNATLAQFGANINNTLTQLNSTLVLMNGSLTRIEQTLTRVDQTTKDVKQELRTLNTKLASPNESVVMGG